MKHNLLNSEGKTIDKTYPLEQKSDNADIFLSIVIVNFNGKNFLSDCFNSINKHVNLSYEVILVDNASWDGSADYVRLNHPEVQLIVNPVNTGFTGGNNLGAKQARGKYLLLLNNDTVVRSSLEPMLQQMEADPKVGVLGCQLMYGNGTLQESIGYMPSALSLILSWTPLARLFPNIKFLRRTVSFKSNLYKKSYIRADWVSGACLMTRLDLWNKLDGLDEKYFMYMEDVDYCLRVQKSGSYVFYTSLCQVTHFEGSGRHWVGARALLNTTDSYLVYFAKFHGRLSFVFTCVSLALVFLLRSLGYISLYIFRVDMFGVEKSKAYFLATVKLIAGIFYH